MPVVPLMDILDRALSGEAQQVTSRSFGVGRTERFFNALALAGQFQPVLAKHSKHFSLQNALSIGVDQMQRNFEPMRRQVDEWRATRSRPQQQN